MTTEHSQHPDDLQLVAYAENSLLDFEREGVEAHLADCPTCRTLVAGLALDAEEHGGQASTPLRAIRPRAQFSGVLRVLLAAALVMLLVRFIPWSSSPLVQPEFVLGVSNTRDGVFQNQRGDGDSVDEFYVGVRLEADGFVRLVGFDQTGVALEIPLDETGATSIRYDGATEYIFGPYPLQLDENQWVHTVAAFVSSEDLPWQSIESANWPLDAVEPTWRENAADLGARVQVTQLRTEQ
jgi:hypothetical protein